MNTECLKLLGNFTGEKIVRTKVRAEHEDFIINI